LEFLAAEPSRIQVEIYDMSAHLLDRVTAEIPSSGRYHIDVAGMVPKENLVFIRATLGGRSEAYRYFRMRDGTFAARPGLANASIESAGFAKVAATLDTLKVTAAGFTTRSLPLSTYDTTVNVRMESSGGGGSADAVKSAGCGKAPTITTGSAKQIMVGGTARTYNIQIPDGYDNNKPYRLIIGYHGASQSANTVTGESYFGLRTVAQDAILVAPQGIGNAWPNTGGADVTFSRQLVIQLEEGLCIDKKRIFAEGFSMGGAMAYSMACTAPDVVRGVAVHSGCPITACTQQHTTPVAYFMTHGTQDQICGYPRFGVPLLQDFAKVNGCTTPDPSQSATAFEAALPNPTSASSACIEFTGCKTSNPVRSCLFVGPHAWNPGRPTWVPAEVWNFFKQL
ncbi:MAG: hypothetical protein ABIW76_16350, partial [Fibrobacteria bacterium]